MDEERSRVSASPRRIIGYYAGWTRKSKNYMPADIPAEHLTHINYAFGLIDEDGRAMLGDAEDDIGGSGAGGELAGNFQHYAGGALSPLTDDDFDWGLDWLRSLFRRGRHRAKTARVRGLVCRAVFDPMARGVRRHRHRLGVPGLLWSARERLPAGGSAQLHAPVRGVTEQLDNWVQTLGSVTCRPWRFLLAGCCQ